MSRPTFTRNELEVLKRWRALQNALEQYGLHSGPFWYEEDQKVVDRYGSRKEIRLNPQTLHVEMKDLPFQDVPTVEGWREYEHGRTIMALKNAQFCCNPGAPEVEEWGWMKK